MGKEFSLLFLTPCSSNSGGRSQEQWQCFVTIVMKVAFSKNMNFLWFGSIIHKDPKTLSTYLFCCFGGKKDM